MLFCEMNGQSAVLPSCVSPVNLFENVSKWKEFLKQRRIDCIPDGRLEPLKFKFWNLMNPSPTTCRMLILLEQQTFVSQFLKQVKIHRIRFGSFSIQTCDEIQAGEQFWKTSSTSYSAILIDEPKCRFELTCITIEPIFCMNIRDLRIPIQTIGRLHRRVFRPMSLLFQLKAQCSLR